MRYILITVLLIVSLLLLLRHFFRYIKNNYLVVLTEYNDLYNKKKILENEIKSQKEIENNLKNSNNLLNSNFNQLQQLKLKELNNYIEEEKIKKESLLVAQTQSLKDELAYLEDKLEEAKRTQNIINTKIREQKIKEEEINFHKIQISESDLEDIKILLEVKEKLKNNKLLDKIIYDNYISKNTTEMCKRVLNNRKPSGIYKITRLKTGEIYIGKSTNVYERWREHSKACFGVSSISYSRLHETMRKDGISNFTFELLEETPKEKLAEREKYWISFFDSNNYGLNERK